MCQNCEYNSPKYLGRCPNCGAWSSFIEEVEVAEVKNARVSLTGGEKTERRNLRPACCLYLLVSLRSVRLLALLIQIQKIFLEETVLKA